MNMKDENKRGPTEQHLFYFTLDRPTE